MNSDQKVGYKRPPAHARFKPGQSGNPKGRPKRRPNLRDALFAELAQTVAAADASERQPKLQALVRTLVDTAIEGNARAQSVLVSLLARLGEHDEIDEQNLAADDQEILDEYVGGELKRRRDAPPTHTEPKED